MKTTKFLALEKELKPYIGTMSEASDTILDQEITRYPIFVVHKLEVAIGVSLVESTSESRKWSINASSLEEFVSKQLIEMNKIDSFKTIYKDPKKYLCLFVLSDLGANFIFLKRS